MCSGDLLSLSVLHYPSHFHKAPGCHVNSAHLNRTSYGIKKCSLNIRRELMRSELSLIYNVYIAPSQTSNPILDILGLLHRQMLSKLI